MHLTVIHPFSREDKNADGKVVDSVAYAKGDKIFDHDEIIEVLEGENCRNVVRTADLGDPVNGTKPV